MYSFDLAKRIYIPLDYILNTFNKKWANVIKSEPSSKLYTILYGDISRWSQLSYHYHYFLFCRFVLFWPRTYWYWFNLEIKRESLNHYTTTGIKTDNFKNWFLSVDLSTCIGAPRKFIRERHNEISSYILFIYL